MPIERLQQIIEEPLNPETLRSLKEEILAAWKLLPVEHQAILLQSLGTALKEDAQTFHIYSLNHEILKSIFNDQELTLLGEHGINQIANEMREGFLFDDSCWFAVQMIGQRILGEPNTFTDLD